MHGTHTYAERSNDVLLALKKIDDQMILPTTQLSTSILQRAAAIRIDKTWMMEPSSPSRKRPRNDDERSWFIFPPKVDSDFCVGQSVLLVAGKSGGSKRGSIVSLDPESGDAYFQESSSENKIKIKKKELRRLLLPDLPTSSHRCVFLTPETNHFRRLAAYVASSDRVLEIGCSSGETSKLLWAQNCQSWIGFDTSEEALQMCQTALTVRPAGSTMKYHSLIVNALVDPRKAKAEANKFGADPTVVFLDIGGNREIVNVLRMTSWALREFDPRLVVVKSRELVHTIKTSENKVEDLTGLIENGEQWFQQNRTKRALPKHPLKAALVMSPIDPSKPICRYYNYHKNGCKRGDDCDLDHEHCHACLCTGHIARDCTSLTAAVDSNGSN